MFSSIFNFNFTCFSDDGAASTADGDKKSTRGKRGSSSSAVQQKGVGDDDDDEDDEDDDDDDDDEDDEEEDDEDDEEEDEPKRSPSSASSSSSKKAASKTEGSPGPVPLGNADRAEVLSMLETNATPETIVRAMKIAAQAGDLTIGLAILDVVLGALSPAAILHDLGSAGVCRATVRLIEVHEKNQDVFAKGIKILAQLGKEPSNIALFDAKPTALCLSKCMRAFPDPESLLLVAQVVELLLQGDTLNHKSMAASFLDNDLFVQLVNAIDSQEENLSNTSLVNTVCRILVELCPVRPTGTCHTSIDLAHTFSVLQDVLDRVFLVHQSQRAAAEFSDVVAAKEHFKWACRTYGVPVDRISGTDGPRVRKKRHISKQNLLKMLEIMLHVTDSSSVGVATRILTGQQDDPFPRKESKSKNNAGEGGKAVGSLQSSSSLSPSTSQRFQGDSKTTQSYQAYCKALQAAVTFISDEDDGTDGTQEMQTELPSGENQNADSDVSAPTNPTALSPASTSVVAAYFSNPPEPRPPSPPPIGPLIGKRPKGFVHRSRRFDVETSLRYDSSKKHSLPPSAVAFKKSISADRSSGPLYNADIQYSMALAKCGPYYSSKRSSTAAAPPVTLTPYDAERCIERLAKTASMDPLNKNALFYLGKLLSEFRDNRLSDDAENFFKDVLALDPVHPEVYYNLGQIFFQRCDYSNAFDCFKSAVMVDPLDLDARVYKAICLGRLGGIQNTADAIGEYKFVLETDENYYLALYHFGSLLVALNDVSGAIFYFQRLIMVDPESIEALLVTARAHCLRYLQTIQQSANQVGIMVTAPTSPGTSAEGTSSPSKPTSRVGQGSADVKLISNAIDDLKRAMRCYEQLVGLDEVQPMTDIYECIVEDVAMIASDLTNQLAKLATARK